MKSPRNFFLLCPSRLDLSPTLRSRSLAIYLGAAAAMPAELLATVATGFRGSVERFTAGGGALWLLDAASRLDPAGKRTKAELEAAKKRAASADEPEVVGFEDPRDQRPWLFAAAAVRMAAMGHGDEPPAEPALRRPDAGARRGAPHLVAAAPARHPGRPHPRRPGLPPLRRVKGDLRGTVDGRNPSHVLCRMR